MLRRKFLHFNTFDSVLPQKHCFSLEVKRGCKILAHPYFRMKNYKYQMLLGLPY